MKYMGSKNRIAKHILPIITADERSCYFEPFVGGGNMIDKVSGDRIGCDLNRDAVEALILIRDNVNLIPKDNSEFTEADYKLRCKNMPWLRGFASFAYSYGGKHWGGWCRDKGGRRDYVAESYRNAVKQSDNLGGVDFYICDYRSISLPDNTTIYCDPPYKSTTGYKDKFNHEEFYQWCIEKSGEGHKVYISEYSMPDGFTCVWEKEVNSSLTKDTGSKKNVERLFTPTPNHI